jgi:acyl-CoA dehydrogenase
MNFDLSSEQRMLIDTVRRFIAEQLAPLEDGIEVSGHLDDDAARSIHSASKALGLYGLNMPTELGGAGLCAVDAMLCEEQFGHTTDILIRRAFGNVYEALLACTGDQVPRWLLPSVTGDRTCAIAITLHGRQRAARFHHRQRPADDGHSRHAAR